jgi:competence protein ComEA
MKTVLAYRVPAAWLLLAVTVTAAAGIVFKLAVMDAPPRNSVLITAADPESRSTGAADSAPTRVGEQAVAGAQGVPSSAAATPQPSATASAAAAAGGASVTPVAASEGASATPRLITVYVSGAVRSPGVYSLPDGARISDALAAAGGPSADADLERVNLAERVVDEEQVSIPASGAALNGQVVPPAPGPTVTVASRPTEQEARSTPRPSPQGKININTASAPELELLPGIGPTLAGRIIEFRRANGPFQSTEELMKVPGIKQGVYGKLREQVTVGP